MKNVTKRTKLLKLNLETVRNLSGTELALAVGGNETQNACPTMRGCGSDSHTGTV